MTDNLKNLFTHNPELEKKFRDLPFPTKKTEEWIYTNPSLLFDGINQLTNKKTATDLQGDICFSNGELVKNTTSFSLETTSSKIDVTEATSALQEVATSYLIDISGSHASPIFIHQNYCGGNQQITSCQNGFIFHYRNLHTQLKQ